MAVTISGTSGITGVDGTAAAPSVTGTDTNTGLTFPAADTVSVATGGTEAMRVNSSQNVGVGTTSPGSKLDVKGTLRLSGSTSGYVGIAPAAAAGSTTYTLPSADGTSGQMLSTNGSGTLSWATAGGVTSAVAGNGITVSSATGAVTISQDIYTGSTATNTSYPIGSYVCARSINTGTQVNSSATLYGATTTGIVMFVGSSGGSGSSALTGTWRARGESGEGSAPGCDTYIFTIFQRTA